MKIISKQYEETKCGGCNWKTTVKYALENHSIDKEGLCGNCFVEMLIEQRYNLIKVM